MGPRIAIRVDGSHQIGMGHVYRMVNLAEALRQIGLEHIAFCSFADESVSRWLRQNNFPVEILGKEAEKITPITNWLAEYKPDLLINDILDTGIDYMSAMAGSGCSIINFDDNGPGRKLADCRINALPCKMLSCDVDSRSYQGPDYLLLGEEFSLPSLAQTVCKRPDSILVSLGGSDTYGNTLAVVRALQRCKQLKRIHVVAGPAFGHWAELMQAVRDDGRCVVDRSVKSIYKLMQENELAVVGGGIMLFESARCALPTLSIASEDFERANIQWAEDKGITRFAGEGQPVDVEVVFEAAWSLLEDPVGRLAMSELGPRVVDGGGRQRVVDIIRALCSDTSDTL
jgi:spore coat polysaccharide biosynthesis predicted glycosyltransferase SpsG